MADLVYVNVGGTWKTVNRYYVNVNGTWKTGNTIQGNLGGTWSSLLGGFPTATQVGTLDYSDFTVKPDAWVDAKQSISSDGLDNRYYGCQPSWTRESDFVYSPPAGGGSPPPDVLPTYSSHSYNFDTYLEFKTSPKYYTSSTTGIDGTDHEIVEFDTLPLYTQKNTVAAYVPPSGGGGSQTSILPDKADVLTMDWSHYGCMPAVRAATKSGIDSTTLDYSEFTVRPYYTVSA